MSRVILQLSIRLSSGFPDTYMLNGDLPGGYRFIYVHFANTKRRYMHYTISSNKNVTKFFHPITVLRCQTLLPPLNGFLLGKCENTFGSTCTFGCDDGYKLLGAQNISCEASPGHITGYWDNPVPVCKGKHIISK